MNTLRIVAVSLIFLSMSAAHGQDASLIEQGRRLFFDETFDGNGRTCGTCHPANNNFTIDPDFIRTLPGNDPLFIAAPSLRGDLRALEVMRLIRRNALILENLDGFEQDGVMRSVPHTLALRTSIDASRVGWSGDGSPGGDLRSFATGAVIQHMTRSIERVEGQDFRLPTPDELAALEAFQLSLGRQEEIDLAALDFIDPEVARGRELFMDAPTETGSSSCNSCHANAGTGDAQVATDVALLPAAPACIPSSGAPGDGGRGHEPVEEMARAALCGRGPSAAVTFRGDGTFNAPPLIEAADTPPFFHNNAVATLEGAVSFYTTATFGNSPAGQFGGGAFVLDGADVDAIGALLRVLNALENIRSANAYSADGSPALARAETEDAVQVLAGGPLALHPDAVDLLREAASAEAAGQGALATDLRNEARSVMVQ